MMTLNWTLVITFINFGLLYLLLRLVLFKPVGNVLAARQNEIDQAFAASSAEKGEAEKTRAEYEAKLRDIYETAHETIEKAKAEGRQAQQEMIDRTQKSIDDMRARAEAEIELRRQRVYAEMREKIIDLSIQMASQAIARSKGADIRRDQLEAFLAGLEHESR